MNRHSVLDEDLDLFSTKRLGNIIILNLKENLMFRAVDLTARDTLLDFLDWISKTDSIKVVVIISSPTKTGKKEYFDFFHQELKSKSDYKNIHRIHNVFCQFILKLMELNKVVVHANCGKVIPLFLNVSLACDYRIIADNTVFQNPYLNLGLIPIGGSAFFLSKIIGPHNAFKVLIFGSDITAYEAMKLGIVHEVIPASKLEEAVLDTAKSIAKKPLPSLVGIKKLINYTMKDFKDYMDLEHQELLRIVGSHKN
jgi:2-(1,2-epoxy-1,2-dihydrophenyl)acetyl-CoA isomerase